VIFGLVFVSRDFEVDTDVSCEDSPRTWLIFNVYFVFKYRLVYWCMSAFVVLSLVASVFTLCDWLGRLFLKLTYFNVSRYVKFYLCESTTEVCE